MSRAKIIDYYFEKSRQPDFEIDQIRKDLKGQMDDEEIGLIVRVVDNEIQRRLNLNEENKKAAILIWFGGAICGLGLLVTIGTYTGLINTGRSFIIAFGPILGGLSLLLFGVATRRKAD